MEIQAKEKLSKLYLISVSLFMLILPVISITIESTRNTVSIVLAGKWFVFWGIGMRLLTAGLRQSIKPAFTAQGIFRLQYTESHILVRELGFANICFGLAGILSLWIPEWRTAAGFTGGLYMGIAGVMHIVKKPATPNEWVALISDVFIFLAMAGYIAIMQCGSSAFDITFSS